MRKAPGIIALLLAFASAGTAQVRGYVVASGAERSDILVSLESQSGQIVDQAFTGSRGQFLLEGVSIVNLRSDNPMYIVVREEGYKPYRERILQADLRSGGRAFTIFLEEDVPLFPPEDGGDGTVDVRQLQSRIPDGARDAYSSALEADDNGDHALAIERLQYAVQLAPDYYDAWVELGSQYDGVGQWEDSRAAYLAATKANPGGALAHLNIGALYYQEGDRIRAEGVSDAGPAYALAREWLEKAIQLDPTSAAAGFYLGAALYRLGRYDESEEWLLRGISMDDGYAAGAQSMLINLYARQRRYVAALEQAEAFLDRYPDAVESEAVERVRLQLRAALGL